MNGNTQTERNMNSNQISIPSEKEFTQAMVGRKPTTITLSDAGNQEVGQYVRSTPYDALALYDLVRRLVEARNVHGNHVAGKLATDILFDAGF